MRSDVGPANLPSDSRARQLLEMKGIDVTKQRLSVEGMHCSSCSMLIDEALQAGVSSSSTSVRKARTDVDYDPAVTSLDVIHKTLVELGYTARPA